MLLELSNPLTENYQILKKDVLSDFFPWFWIGNTVENSSAQYANTFFFGHSALTRPKVERLYPTPTSDKHWLSSEVLKEIFEYNKIEINSVMRINFNLTLPSPSETCAPHLDHPFPHKNLLIYLNDSEGDTVVKEERSSPKEDKIIVFEGLHYHYMPKTKRRVAMVCTFI